MLRRKASGFDQNHTFWPEALGLWRQGYSNAQVAAQAQAQGYDLNEDQVRYARNRYWTADELPARGAKWLREAVREATEVYPSALEQQQALFSENYEVFIALKQRLLSYLNGAPPADELELAQMKVLLESYARQGASERDQRHHHGAPGEAGTLDARGRAPGFGAHRPS